MKNTSNKSIDGRMVLQGRLGRLERQKSSKNRLVEESGGGLYASRLPKKDLVIPNEGPLS